MTSREPGSRFLLAWLALLGFANALLWGMVVPPWQTPDEPKHFEYVRLIAECGRLVAFASESQVANDELQQWILASMDEHHFWWFGRAPAYNPDRPPARFADVWVKGMHTAFYRSSPVYYWLLAQLQPGDRLVGLYIGRLFSALLAGLIVLCAGWSVRWLFPCEPWIRYGVPLFVALHPMFAFVHAGVNNDVLLNALAAVTFLLVVRLIVRGPSLTRLVWTTAALLASFVVKRTGVFLIPPVAIGLVLGWAGRSRYRWLRTLTGSAALGAIGMASWRLWQAGRLAFPAGRWGELANRYLFNEPDQPNRILTVLAEPASRPILVEYVRRMHDTFWGSYGWDAIRYPSGFYVAVLAVAAVALLGLARRALDGRLDWAQGSSVVTALTTWLATVVMASLFFAAYLYEPYAPPPQGRYLMAALIPTALVMAVGLGAWLSVERQRTALRTFMIIMLLFDGITLLGMVVPYYYG